MKWSTEYLSSSYFGSVTHSTKLRFDSENEARSHFGECLDALKPGSTIRLWHGVDCVDFREVPHSR
jgi:hypothetical protein